MALLEVKALTKNFKNVKAVQNVSFEVQKGDILGLLGPNGAGKSTTISMISTLIKPDSGSILYNQEDIIKKPKAIQRQLGYVSQEIALYPMLSGKENLFFWGRAYGLTGTGLKNAVAEVAQLIGIEERLKEKVKNYSGGMKRRLNIGVSLLHTPELIIMDEPTVGIDPQSRKHILDTVLELNKKGMTVIYTSHYLEEVEYLCNQICIMDEGKIVAKGSKEYLLSQMNDEISIHLKVIHLSQVAIIQLKQIESIKAVYEEKDYWLIKSNKDPGIFEKIVSILSQNSISIQSMDIIEPSLETVFLKLTGRGLRD